MRVERSAVRMSGLDGVIRWGYRHAARLGRWTIQDGYLRADVQDADAFLITQRPLLFVIQNQQDAALSQFIEQRTGRRWMPRDFRRELVDVSVNGSVLTARVGPRR